MNQLVYIHIVDQSHVYDQLCTYVRMAAMSTIQTRNNSGRVNSLHCLDSTSFFSLPFYSGHYGYTMCLCLYILGDGTKCIGKNIHMSLFFVIMKGEFDAIFQWP